MKLLIFPFLFFFITVLALACNNLRKAPAENAVGEANSFEERMEHSSGLISTIAFGSCGHEDEPQPILALAAQKNPDLFIFLGDNIYGDTYEMDTLQAKYDRLGAKAEFQQLAGTAPLLATWDDHDYGWNDSGRHYPFKQTSKEIFLEFFDVAADDVRRQREGIYTSYYFYEAEDTLQILILDTRTFRDDVKKYDGQAVDTAEFFYSLDYYPYEAADSTLLGNAQWQWLEQQLEVPADVRLIASSTQFGISWNGYEAWANFPHEQKRLTDLIRKTDAEGAFFISGDVHYAEISEFNQEGLYPLYDVTSSGITSTWRFATPNDHRIAGPVMENNFGLITIDWSQTDPLITFQIYDVENQPRIAQEIRLSQLQLP